MRKTASHLVLLTLTAAAVIVVSTTGAEARRHRAAPICDPWAFWEPCGATVAPKPRVTSRRVLRRADGASHGGGVVAHPAGCPRTAFCGCGAVHRLQTAWGVSFGHPRGLWLARAWLRFPTAAPAPGMAAASFEHVFILEQHVAGDVWLAYDANSGGHLTRIHQRSIAGYSIVNPRT